MVFFFALAAKEVFEATLPGGPLASPRRALSPLAAAVGGMAAPALIYLALALTRGPADLARGWAIPCATDIAFSAMVARLVFPTAHPAIPFLLLLAIADDALGLVILAVFYPSGPLSPWALVGLMAAAVLAAMWLRRRRMRSFWAYVLGPGALSWAALYFGGFHPALALVPIVPFMPHSPADLGLFDPREEYRPDTLNRFEHWWATPVQFVLLLFGLPGSFWESPSAFCCSRTPLASQVRACHPGFASAIFWLSALRLRLASPWRCSLRRPLSLVARRWPKRKWVHSSVSSRRLSRWPSPTSSVCHTVSDRAKHRSV
jgi:Na+/H+ antiporter 1